LNEAIKLMTANFAEENGLDHDAAKKLVDWFENEGLLDYEGVRDIYSEPTELVPVETVNVQ